MECLTQSCSGGSQEDSCEGRVVLSIHQFGLIYFIFLKPENLIQAAGVRCRGKPRFKIMEVNHKVKKRG
jgi:hypothetical protein